MPKSLLHYKNNKIWVHDNHLELILFYCSKLPSYQQNEEDWMSELKKVIPFYLQGFVPGAIDLKLNENLINTDRTDYFIQLLNETKASISELGSSISVDQLNQVEELKGVDAVQLDESIETETITTIIDQLIAFIRQEDIDELAPLKTNASKTRSRKGSESIRTSVIQHLRLIEKLESKALKLKNGLLYDGMWEGSNTITIKLSQINNALEDLTFSFKEIEKSYFSELGKKLNVRDFKYIMKASKIVSEPFGETILYTTRLKQSAYFLIKQSGNRRFLLCLGSSEIQPMRWNISLESIHVVN